MKKFIGLLLICSIALAETVISPNMNLPVPVVGTTPGPDWANNINSCMGAIDSHDHTPGHGVQISSEALSITSDLSLNNNSLTDTKSVVFNAQTSTSTRQAVYVISPDLIYNDGNGNAIRITQSGAVAGASGTITGLPSGTASASFQSVGGTFQFQSASNTPANGTFASLSIAQQTTSPNTITLKSPNSLGASYNVTFPTSVPSLTSLLAMSTSGVLSTVAYTAPTQQYFTSGSGTYSTPSSPAPLYLRVRMVGGGGGGGGSGSGATGGGTGGNTTFGSSLLTANAGAGRTGGTASISSPAHGSSFSGGPGGPGTPENATTNNVAGGMGASTPFGGGGTGGNGGANDGTAPPSNTGGGGGGGGLGAVGGSNSSGLGGGAGGYIDAIIPNPSATYSYSVGTFGAAGVLGTGGAGGGSGAIGYIEVTEYYN